jgi:hypothetical protein
MRAISLLTVDGVVRVCRAASEKLPLSTTRRKTCTSPMRLSIPGPPPNEKYLAIFVKFVN